MADARRQALSDAAAAISCMHEALRFKAGVYPPSEATAVFSLCADANIAELRIHWRETEDDGSLRWYSAVVGPKQGGLVILAKEDEVYRIRSYIPKTLEWAQTQRWDMLKTAMLHHHKLVMQTTSPDVLTGIATPATSSHEQEELRYDPLPDANRL